MKWTSDRILLIGDGGHELAQPLAAARPQAQITAVSNYFDAIAELTDGRYSAVLAAAEPIERRPEAAVRTLRQLVGAGRLILFGQPTLEPVSRRMLNEGCDDYVVTPTSSQELAQILGAPLRLAAADEWESGGEAEGQSAGRTGNRTRSLLAGIPMTDILLDCLVQHPGNAPAVLVKEIAVRLGSAAQLRLLGNEDDPPAAGDGQVLISHPARGVGNGVQVLHLVISAQEEESTARHFLSQLAEYLARLATLADRHNALQKLAITDELTTLYNGRYFRHFLTKIIDRARDKRFPVTLLMFDIDNFKNYNDEYGHQVGDEILKQTAAMMKKCCRDHDLVARLSSGGDEFAVVFWEKDSPGARTAKEGGSGTLRSGGRPPQTPLQIAQRFRKTIATGSFSGLGPAGKGSLTISGGLAIYPYDAQTPEDLIAAADKALMFGAKAAGKNSIFLVGGEGAAEDEGE